MATIIIANLFNFNSHFESNRNSKNHSWPDKQINLKKAKPPKGGDAKISV